MKSLNVQPVGYVVTYHSKISGQSDIPLNQPTKSPRRLTKNLESLINTVCKGAFYVKVFSDETYIARRLDELNKTTIEMQ